MNQNLTSKYDRLNQRAIALVDELVKVERSESTLRAKMIRVVTDMCDLFKSKPVGSRLGSYYLFDAWVEDLIKPLLGVDKRSIYYFIHVGHHLLGKVTDEEINKMGIERAKLLSKVAEVKGKVSKTLVEDALASTVDELKVKVRAIINPRDNDMHDNEGEWITVEIKGPRRFISGIQRCLAIMRRQDGHKPSDAEEIYDVLKAHVSEIEAAEEDRRRVIAGVDQIVEETVQRQENNR